MPISSIEIAQANAAFQQSSMNQMAYSGMIGQGYYGSGAQADRMAGGVTSAISSVGSPLAKGAMGMLGLDPMSLGLRAGMSAFGSGAGVGGSMMAGAAVALPLMAAGAGISYAGGQMMQGANQQSQLNDTLRSSFNFRNSMGGQGFTRSDMTSIGGLVRTMSDQVGPGGDMASFRELSNVAGKMGQMGFAQGVRDVQEFSKRFKEMVTTLKTMSQELGTTLEGAMEFAHAAKGSGVFGMGRASAFTSFARQQTVSGGLALSEVTGAASIGSQISRSIGGLGRQGAMAGARTIGQIGTAQQMGVLSEEDIYNVTGLTGAEGRQAYAASALSSSARFLQSGRGRRVLASMAEKNGQLDEGAVQQLLSGGMGIQETMQQDSAHLGRVGRANFIRNEGRLRGAALERLGGFLPALQMQQWAQSKGIDINNMDDRSMLFAQRQLGMGRDEVDQAVKMAQALPDIIAQQASDAQKDRLNQTVGEARKGMGIEGIKQRLSRAREEVNNKLQKAGQDIFNDGAQTLEAWANRLSGEYVETFSADIDKTAQDLLRGGASGARAAQRLGIGGSGMSARAESLASKADISGLRGISSGSLAEQMTRGSQGGFLDSLSSDLFGPDTSKGGATAARMMTGSETLRYIFQGKSMTSQLKDNGFDFSGMNDKQIRDKFSSIEKIKDLAATSVDSASATYGAGANGDWIRNAYALGRISGEGDDRMQSFGAALSRSDPSKYREWQNADQSKRAIMMSNMERGAGVGGEGALASRYGVPDEMTALLRAGKGKFASTGEESEAFGRAFYSKGELEQHQDITLGILTDAGSRFAEEAGTYIKGAEFQKTALSLMSKDKETALRSREDLQKELASASPEARKSAAFDVKQRLLEGANYMKFVEDHPNATPEEIAKFSREQTQGSALDSFANMQYDMAIKQGMSPEEANKLAASLGGGGLDRAKRAAGAAAAIASVTQQRDQAEIARRFGAAGKLEYNALEQRGRFTRDDKGNVVLSEDTQKRLGSAAAGGGLSKERLQELTKEGIELARLQSQIGDGPEGQKALQEFTEKQKGFYDLAKQGTLEQRRAVASALAGTSSGDELGRQSAVEGRFMQAKRSRGTTAAVIQGLGLQLDEQTRKDVGDITKGGDVERLIQATGATDQKTIAAFRAAVKSGDVKSIAEKTDDLKNDPGAKQKREKQTQEDQEAANPLQAAMKKSLESIDKHMKTVAEKTGSMDNSLKDLKDNPVLTKEG